MSNRQKMKNPDTVDTMTGARMIGGHLVSATHARLVEAIRAYSPELEVGWIPPRERRPGQAAWCIQHVAPENNNEPYTLFFVEKDEDFDERVLTKIIMNDQRTKSVQLSEFEAHEEAIKRMEHQVFIEMLEEQNDIAAHVLKTRKNRYKVNDNLIIDDTVPFNVANTEF